MLSRKLFFNKRFAFSVLISLGLNSVSFANLSNNRTANEAILGSATYKTMLLHELPHAQTYFIDTDLLLEKKLAAPQDSEAVRSRKLLSLYGYAAKAEGEFGGTYGEKTKQALVDGTGGLGLNGNLGSGRAAIIDDWQIKGSGKTMMVNSRSDNGHRNGASPVTEGVWEAAVSNILFNELPYGSFRILSLITTGAKMSNEADAWPRGLMLREDPLRPSHYVQNPDGLEIHPEFESARVSEAMKNIVTALPKPIGYVSQNRQADFIVGIHEFIHRQAVQQGFMWAHSLMHGATSPANAGLDGRMIDFGTFAAFEGYPKAQILEVEGYFGEVDVIHKDLIKDTRDSWVKTLPADLLKVLPSEQALFDFYEKEFENVRHAEMLRLAGAFTELAPKLYDTSAGNELARTLIKMAEAGNETLVKVYAGEKAVNKGTYSLPKILAQLAASHLETLNANDAGLSGLVPDSHLRETLVRSYKQTFGMQKSLASTFGVSAFGEAAYREHAVKIRNHKYTALFEETRWGDKVNVAVREQMANPASHSVQQAIEGIMKDSRREYWDAAPFTIVISEKIAPNGDRIRHVLDGKTGVASDITLSRAEVTTRNSLEVRRKNLIDASYRQVSQSRVRSCSAAFFR